MRFLTVIPIILALVFNSTDAQEHDTLKKIRYGIELNNFVTGSGFGLGTELNLTIIPDPKKNFSLGLFVSPSTMKFSGVILHHERSLSRRAEYSKLVPYAFYNLIYRITKTKKVVIDNNYQGEYILYRSMEHHLGVGLQVRLGRHLYLKNALGYGVYLRSIKKPADPDPVTGEISGGNGLGPIAKAGLTFVF